MKFLISFSILAFIAGCATQQVPFQKKQGEGMGYIIENLEGNFHFRAKTTLPMSYSEVDSVRYLARAIGEECLHRGYKYFDLAEFNSSSGEGFCFNGPTRKSLAITFADKELRQPQPKFLVASLNNKKNTQLLNGDEVLKIGKTKIASMGQLKINVLTAAHDGKYVIPLEVRRGNRTLVLKETIVDLKNGGYGPDDLEALRVYPTR